MNKTIRWLAALGFALSLGACEQQNAPATTATADASKPLPADASDTLNCKIEAVDGAALAENAIAGPAALPGKLELSGWVMLDHTNRAPESVSLEFADAATPATVLHEIAAAERAERPDVDQVFSAKPGSRAGFVAREDASTLAAGTYQVQVVGKDSGNRYACPHLVQLRVEAAAAP